MNRGSLGAARQRIETDCILPTSAPEFTCNAKVFATPYKCIALASFSRGWDSRGFEVFLLASCNPYQPTHKTLARRKPTGSCSGYLPRHTSAYSLLTTFGPTFVSLRGASPHPPGPKALLRIRRYFISGRYISPSNDGSGSNLNTGIGAKYLV